MCSARMQISAFNSLIVVCVFAWGGALYAGLAICLGIKGCWRAGSGYGHVCAIPASGPAAFSFLITFRITGSQSGIQNLWVRHGPTSTPSFNYRKFCRCAFVDTVSNFCPSLLCRFTRFYSRNDMTISMKKVKLSA